MKLTVEQWIGLVQFGWTTFTQIRAAFRDGKAKLARPGDESITGEEAIAALDDAITAMLGAGDAAANRLEGRTP